MSVAGKRLKPDNRLLRKCVLAACPVGADAPDEVNALHDADERSGN